jgi:hypothetical protein
MAANNSGQNAWEVHLNGKHIDTVFYQLDCDKDYVRRSLIDHDHMDPNITVKLRPY